MLILILSVHDTITKFFCTSSFFQYIQEMDCSHTYLLGSEVPSTYLL